MAGRKKPGGGHKHLLGCALFFLLTAVLFALPPAKTAKGEEPFPLVEGSIQVGETTRWYLLYLPPAYDGQTPLPLVFVLHGAWGSMTRMAELRSDLLEIAKEEGSILVFPNGQNSTDNKSNASWKALHCCPPAVFGRFNDLAFIRALSAALRADLAIDRNHIHAVGFSNGAMFTHLLAAEMPAIFASVAPISGTVGGQIYAEGPVKIITPGAPVPILLVHGTADSIVRYEGGQPANGTRVDLPFAESVNLWVANNGAGPPARETLSGPKGAIYIDTYPGGTIGANVSAVTIENHGHTWPTLEGVGIDINKEIMAFFTAHPQRNWQIALPVISSP